MEIEIDDAQTRNRPEDLNGVIYNNGWQPIETAPKDHSAMLLYSNLWGVCIGRWEPRKTMHGFWLYDGYEGREIEFHYWMPLPKPPVSRETLGE